ncbi:MAG: tail protein X [Desulfovibrionaceae bacterium]|nr:tail protein X [Desulfovibrionaceae bacterium]
MTAYTTIQGDTWDGIAFRLWGREHLMSALLRANPDHADVLIFPAGIILTVPDVNPEATQPITELPPWIRSEGREA